MNEFNECVHEVFSAAGDIIILVSRYVLALTRCAVHRLKPITRKRSELSKKPALEVILCPLCEGQWLNHFISSFKIQ